MNLRKLFGGLCCFGVLVACEPEPGLPPVNDPHSYARPAEARVQHLDLDIKVDFEQSQISGVARLEVLRPGPAEYLYLDTKNLAIDSVTISEQGQPETATESVLEAADPILGQALRVKIQPETHFVHVYYHTLPGAEALQFLPKELTADKESPFLLTQSQAINARTWVPIQDSPGIRFTYRARVKVPEGLMAVMSAQNPTQVNSDGLYVFEMKQPIPAYLLALAVGKLSFQALGDRTGVYAQPSVIDAAAHEFAELERMMELAEELYGPYRWGRYDVIVLPASFPFGGMENPRLTFATPTIIAGDRSLVSLLAHELAHSWSGNLVTNATWNDFWLNEGFTVYFENRIMEALKGADYAEMLAQISYEDLSAQVKFMGMNSPDTRLAYEMKGRNPDDGMTPIPYDKGFYFLKLIEQTVGRENFDAFLRDYFEQNAFRAMTTEAFLQRLRKNLLDQYPGAEEAIRVDEWINNTGIPDNIPFQTAKRFEKVEAAVNEWIAGIPASELNTEAWTSHEWQHFIRSLPNPISPSQLASLDSAFHFTQQTNAELQNIWYQRAIEADYEVAYPAIREFLVKVGRRKFLSPLYRAFKKTPEGRERARAIYEVARPNYHPIAVKSIDQILEWQAQ